MNKYLGSDFDEQFLKDYEDTVRSLEITIKALELIAVPKRADGTYNRGREACEILAKEALKKIRGKNE